MLESGRSILSAAEEMNRDAGDQCISYAGTCVCEDSSGSDKDGLGKSKQPNFRSVTSEAVEASTLSERTLEGASAKCLVLFAPEARA